MTDYYYKSLKTLLFLLNLTWISFCFRPSRNLFLFVFSRLENPKSLDHLCRHRKCSSFFLGGIFKDLLTQFCAFVSVFTSVFIKKASRTWRKCWGHSEQLFFLILDMKYTLKNTNSRICYKATFLKALMSILNWSQSAKKKPEKQSDFSSRMSDYRVLQNWCRIRHWLLSLKFINITHQFFTHRGPLDSNTHA